MRSHVEKPASLSTILARYADLVSATTRQVLDPYTEPHEFFGMMRYHLGWVDERLEPIAAARGKGLRSSLLLLVNAALDGDEASAAPFAVAVDLLHNFTLIHDDIEDGSTTRRHRPTVWSIWGTPQAINAGDGLYAIAHLAFYQSSLQHTDPGRFLDVLQRFERTVLRICEGQHLDMTFEHTADVSVDDYVRMIGHKSADLIATAAWVGARAATVSTEQAVDAAGRFGWELGLAFQMQDDILGIWGDEAVTGKSAVSDIVSRKKTLPVLLAMALAAPGVRGRLRALYAHPGDDEAAIREVMAILDGAGARARSNDYLRRHYDAAMDALDEIGLSTQANDRLRAFAGQFVDRSA